MIINPAFENQLYKDTKPVNEIYNEIYKAHFTWSISIAVQNSSIHSTFFFVLFNYDKKKTN